MRGDLAWRCVYTCPTGAVCNRDVCSACVDAEDWNSDYGECSCPHIEAQISSDSDLGGSDSTDEKNGTYDLQIVNQVENAAGYGPTITR